MSLATSSPPLGRGPPSVWRQCYVGESDVASSRRHACMAHEVELVVRDFFLSEDVEVDDVTVIVCYARESRASVPVAVYTIGVLVRGHPVGVPSEQLASWAPDVSSPVHVLTSSESISSRSQLEVPAAFATVRDIFDEDEHAVYVQQFFRCSNRKTPVSRVMFEREPLDETFKRTRSWACAQAVASPCDLVETTSSP